MAPAMLILSKIGTSGAALAQQMAEGMQQGVEPNAIGAQFGATVVAGIEGALVGNFTGTVQQLVTTGMVTPYVDAMLSGATATQAIAAMSTEATLERLRATAAAFREIWSNAEFQAGLEELRTSIGGATATAVSAAGYVPRYTAAIADNTAATKDAADALREEADEAKRIGDERKGLTLALTNLLDSRGNRFALGSPFLVRDRNQITPLQPRTVRIGFEFAF